MLPKQGKLASLLRGFVCNSCLLKLQVYHLRQIWVYRNFSSRYTLRARRISSRVPPRQDREVHFYDQTPDGERTERFVDEDYEKIVQKEFLEEDLKNTVEEHAPTLRKILNSSVPNDYQLSKGLADFEKMGEKFKDLANRLKSASDPENLSPKGRKKLQDLLNNDFFANVDEVIDKIQSTDSGPQENDNVVEQKLASQLNTALNELDQMQDPFSSHSQDSTPNDKSKQNTKVQEGRRASRRFSVTPFPKSYHGHITLLQDCIDAYFEDDQTRIVKGMTVKITKNMVRRHLARAYVFARKGLLATPDYIPSTMWKDLWQILEKDTKENLDRLIYIKRIGDDMEEVGFSMSVSQRLLYAEALFLDGARKAAINQWREAKPSRNDADWDEYWEIGLRMNCQLGRLDEAFKIAETFFDKTKETSRYRALMPLIRACLISQKEFSYQRAWAMYLRLRMNFGAKMVRKDFDVIESWFLDAGQADLALAVFRDMMLTGDQLAKTHDSTAVHRISGILADFNGVKIEQSELQWEHTRALSMLPSKFNNKFFFGSWIKKLIGDNELASAKKVLDLMQDHGIRPSPMHMNGLIGAWFRRGNENDFAVADELAWRMIKTRLEMMDIRDYRHSLEKPLRPNLNGRSVGDKSAFIFPVATIETFSILVQQYRQRQFKKSFNALYTAFSKSRIPPNSRYMNQILLTDTRDHKTSTAFETYRSLVARDVQPNSETFILLWNLMKKSVDPSVGRKIDRQARHVGSCRQLFAEMMKWKHKLIRENEFPRELYDLIILSYSLKQDQVATAVALRALQQQFNIYPDENTIRTIALQLARLGMLNKVGMKPRRLDLFLPATKSRISGVMQLFHKVRNERAEFLSEKGIKPEELSIEARKEESIVITVEVLRHVTAARVFGEKRVEYSCFKAAEQAAQQMGVADCVVWQNEPTPPVSHS